MENYVHLQGITRRFGGIAALQDVTVDVREGELLSFVGPSGAGKTTLLKILAGLDEPTAGLIERRNAITREHPAILVYQDYLLFPHMSVFDNVAFGLRSRRRRTRESRSAIREKVLYYLTELGIADKAQAWPSHLSGGQRQRVALARALVMEPGLLLLDEPFANLDKTLKGETARFIRGLQRDLGVTTVIVSHDLEEAAEVSDRIGVIIDGRLCQVDRFETVYYRPVDLAVARLFGPVNVIPRRYRRTLTDDTIPDGDVIVCARPESLRAVPDGTGDGTVTEVRLVGGTVYCSVAFDGWNATVRTDGAEILPGTRVSIRGTHWFPVPPLPEQTVPKEAV